MSYKLDRIGSKKIIHDLKLKDVHLGIAKGELTGNIFFDKPWVVNIPEKDVANFAINETVYNTYRNYALKHLDEAAAFIYETKRRYTHREILDLVDKASAGFKKLGINESSRVAIMLNGSVEEIVTFLALNKLGATQKYIDYMKSVPAMAHNVSETHLDLLIMDECFYPLNAIINTGKVKLVVANNQNNNYDLTYDMIYEAGNDKDCEPASYKEDKVTLMINSSGTTGPAKPINHTDYSINAAAQKMLYTDYPINNGNVLIKMIPSQIGLGLVTTLYTGLISGAELCIIGAKNGTPDLIKNQNTFIREFASYKEKYGLNKEAVVSTFTAPLFIREIVNDATITDLSVVGVMMGAGSKMDKEELDTLSEIAKAKGYKGEICNAYGQNEMAGAVTLNQNNNNSHGSAGFPVIGTNIIIVDPYSVFPTGDPDIINFNPEAMELVDVKETGLILEQSDSEFKEYEQMPEKTKNSYITMPDGSRWFNTFDLGYMEEDGFLHIMGRMTRVVVRADFKYSLDDIEAKIRNLPFIKDCAAIPTVTGGSKEEFALYYIPTDPKYLDVEVLKKDIYAGKYLSEYEMPDELMVVDNIPYLGAGKINYQYFKQLYKEEQAKSRVKSLEKS